MSNAPAGEPPPPPLIGPADTSTDAVDGPYWDGLANAELRIQQCAGCALWIWAPQWRCGVCGSWELQWPVIEPVGRVHSWTRTHHPVAAEVADAVPYVTLHVELPQAGNVRVLGIWVGHEDPVLGDAVAVEWGPPGSRPHNPYALCWRPAPVDSP